MQKGFLMPSEQSRIIEHPILGKVSAKADICFTFNGLDIYAVKGETISSALFASGLKTFGHHNKDNSPQGIYCANGQCSQCLVLVNGIPVKACMTIVREGMKVLSCEGLPSLPEYDKTNPFKEIERIETGVLIIGGGPSGLVAGIEIAKAGIEGILIDDKPSLGGKLTLQTHAFFGSIKDCWAGTRGIHIGEILTEEIGKYSNFRTWTDTTAIGVFKDGYIGMLKEGRYILVKPHILLMASGAREKALSFPNCDLPGVYGAGAFQTLVNRDLIKASNRLLIVGGGNVGLIVGYHALQAGIDVAALVEAMPRVGGYKVHEDKLKRLGVPIYTSHTIKGVWGRERVEGATIVKVDSNFREITGSEKGYEVDTVLIAVGLNPVNELLEEALRFGFNVFAAGDCYEIAEASAAIFSGKIIGREIINCIAEMSKECSKVEIPPDFKKISEVLKSKPGHTTITPFPVYEGERVMPLIRCYQEIPCNPCVDSCPKNCIKINGDPIMDLPIYEGGCIACGKCVAICPGLAISLLFLGKTQEKAQIMIPHEFLTEGIPVGSTVKTVGMEGEVIGVGIIKSIRENNTLPNRHLVLIEIPFEDRFRVAGFRIRDFTEKVENLLPMPDDAIICRCERVTAKRIRDEIRRGILDMNQLKSVLRCGMGACGGKTCESLILQLYRQEGIDLNKVTGFTKRPLVEEVGFRRFAGIDDNAF